MKGLALIIVLFICVGISVVLHELGHYHAARKFGITPEEFNLGFGPKLLSIHRNGTDWNVRLLPFGGSNVFHKKGSEQIAALPVRSQIHILAAGIKTNLFLSAAAWFIYAAMIGMRFLDAAKRIVMMLLIVIPGTISGFFEIFAPDAVSNAEALGTLGQQMSESTVPVFALCIALFSIANGILGMSNLIPIPALDGGQIVLRIPELFHHPLPEKVRNCAVICSYFFLAGCIAIYVARDLALSLLLL